MQWSNISDFLLSGTIRPKELTRIGLGYLPSSSSTSYITIEEFDFLQPISLFKRSVLIIFPGTGII